MVSEPYDRGRIAMMGGGVGMGGGGTTTGGPVTVATLTVSGPATTSPTIRATLPAPPVAQGPLTGQRRLTFAMAMGAGMGIGAMSFTIDRRTFDPDRDDQTVTLGSTEEWTVLNTSSMDHPFHLHAWPFHVTAASTGTPPTGVQQDVV